MRITNQTQRELYEVFMLDHAAGCLPRGLETAARLHVELSETGRKNFQFLETLGGALLEEDAQDFPEFQLGKPETSRQGGYLSPDDVMNMSASDDNWRYCWLAGTRIKPLRSSDMKLIRLSTGGAIPMHGHWVMEATVVLKGAFSDEFGSHERGDIVFSEPGTRHSPHVVEEGECICFIGRQSNFLQNILYKFGVYDA